MFFAVCAGVCEPVLVEIDCRYVERPAASNGSVLVADAVVEVAVVLVADAVVEVAVVLVVDVVELVLFEPTAEPSTEPNDNGLTPLASVVTLPWMESTAAAKIAPD